MFNAKEIDKIIATWSEESDDSYHTSTQLLERAEKDEAGKLAIVNGKISLKRPGIKGPWPVLVPTDTVEVTYYQQRMLRPFVVEDIENLEVKPIVKVPSSDYQLVVSSDKMEIVLKTQFIMGQEYRLLDSDYNQKLVVKAEPSRTIFPDVIDPELVVEELEEMNVHGEIFYEDIYRACKGRIDTEVVVVKGKPATPPVDGKIDIVCDLKPRPIITDENDRIDYRQRQVINCVEPGDVLAYWQPPVPGVPGVDVFGELVQPRPPRKTKFLVGRGVKLVNNDTVAVAEIAGRPSFQHGRLVVNPQLVIPGDVDLGTGNVSFKGDILIYGNVMESMTIKAGGTVEVMGSVYHATINAGSDVIIKRNLIGGEVSAGCNQVVCLQLVAVLKQLCSELEKLERAFHQLKNHPSFSTKDLNVRGDGYLLKLILELRFKDIPRLFTDLLDVVEELEPDDQVTKRMVDLLESTASMYLGAGPLRIKSIDEVAQNRRVLTELRETFSDFLNDLADVQVNYCHGAKIKATGSIAVTGPLVYNCEMFAGKTIELKGMCRMGVYSAKDSIRVKRAGARGSAMTKLMVAEDGWIGAELFFPDVQIQVGTARMITQTEHQWCKFSYKDGEWETRNLT